MAHEQRAHATLGASSASRWMSCPGSVAAEAAIVPVPGVSNDNPASREGTAAHELLEWCLKMSEPTSAYPNSVIDVGTFKIAVDEEMKQGVQTAVDAIQQACFDAGPNVMLRIEQRVSLALLQPPVPMYGTVDVEIYSPTTQRLHILDFKYGRGLYVPAVDNAQLKYYALGSLLHLRTEGHYVKDATCTIIQPRNHVGDPVRSMTITNGELHRFGGELLVAAEETQTENARRETGSWCKYCKAKVTCYAQYELAQDVASQSFDVVEFTPTRPLDPTTLTDAQIERVLQTAPIITDWFKAVAEFAKIRAFRGDLPGWKVVASGKGHRQWNDANAVIAILGGGITERSIMSVAKVQKLVGKKKVDSLANYITKGSGASILVPTADARPALLSGIEGFDVITDTED